MVSNPSLHLGHIYIIAMGLTMGLTMGLIAWSVVGIYEAMQICTFHPYNYE